MSQHVEEDVATPVVVSDEHLSNLSGQWLVDRYQLGAVCAHGALCVVYEAQDDVLRRAVAIKVSPLALADAYREALAASGGLSHPAFLAVYDVIVQDERLFIAQEYIDGRPLAEYLEDGAPARRSVSLALQIARAIAYAHQHDLAHGDLTPSAILIDRYAVAHVNNVRLPPDWDYFAEVSAVVAQSGIGAHAEETLATLRADERRRDVWSIGALLWTLATRREAGSQQAGATAPRTFREDVPPEVRELLARTLDLRHAQQLITADALALALESLDDALALSTSDQHHATPEAVLAYRDAHVDSATLRKSARGLWGAPPSYEDDDVLASSASDVTDPVGADMSETRPADGPLMFSTEKRYASRPYRHAAAPRAASGWDEQPAWPSATPATYADARVMRPWAWTLIGLALFAAFFLIGFLVIPQLRLY